MKIFIAGLMFALLVGAFTVTGCHADEIDVLNNFYGGLADIIEKNRNSPDECVALAEDFIKKHAGSLNDATESAQAKMESGAAPTEEDVARMMNQPPMQSALRMGAIERFSLIFGIFWQKHPEQAARIQQAVTEYVKD